MCLIVVDDQEKILFDVPVVARLSMGTEHLRLFFTEWRIIAAHVGKRGLGSVGMASFFGWLSGVMEDLFKGSRESIGKRRMAQQTPAEILAGDKDNFFVTYADIISADFSRVSVRPGLTVLTGEDKFQFLVMRGSEQLLDFLRKKIGDKLNVI